MIFISDVPNRDHCGHESGIRFSWEKPGYFQFREWVEEKVTQKVRGSSIQHTVSGGLDLKSDVKSVLPFPSKLGGGGEITHYHYSWKRDDGSMHVPKTQLINGFIN